MTEPQPGFTTIGCAHLTRDGKVRIEASISLGALADGAPERIVLLCAQCWLQVQGAVLSEIAQAAIQKVVRLDGLGALALRDVPE